MTKAEEKLLYFLTRRRIILGYLFVTLLNLYLRKVLVWWNADDVAMLYDGHQGRIQGDAWLFIMRFGLLFPILPIHFMKWVATAGDFALALIGSVILSRDKSGLKNEDAGLAFYSIVLICPFVFIRSMQWSVIESAGIAFMLGAFFFAHNDFLRIILYSCGLLFCPCLIIPLFAKLWHRKEEKIAGAVFVLVFVLSGLIGLINGTGIREGIMGQINFLFYDPMTGVSYSDAYTWISGVIPLYFLPCFVMVLLKCFCRNEDMKIFLNNESHKE